MPLGKRGPYHNGVDDEAQRKAMLLGTRLKTYRLSAGLGVNQLSEYADVSASYISRLERGQVPRPSAPTLQKLAVKLGVSLPALMGTEPQTENAEMDALIGQVKQLPPPAQEEVKEFMRFALQRHRAKLTPEQQAFIDDAPPNTDTQSA